MPERAAPPILGLFGDKASRRAAFRYWISDTVRGRLNLAIHNALRMTPTAFCSAFGASQARFCPMRFPESDARARHLWSALRPESSTPAEVDAAMRRLWRNVARTMAEYSVVDRLWAEGRIAVEGLAHLKAAREAGRPVVLAGLHLANWETLGAVVAAIGYPITSTYEPPENRFDHRIANRVRARYGMRMIYPDRAGGREAYRAVVRDKEIFIFYVDEIFRGRVSAPEFGRGAKIKGNISNTVRLARLTDADIIVAYCTRHGDHPRFTVTFTPPLDQVRTADEQTDLAANVAALDRAIAPIVKDHLDQWYYALDFDFASYEA
jgi:KDO2-lipid IV(A) lauroyltransferase